MSHAITIGGLLLSLGLIAGLAIAAVGALATFAGGMSDAPAEGVSVSRSGCFAVLIGLALSGASLWGLLS